VTAWRTEDVQPGWWAVVDTGSPFAGAIKWAEKLASRGRRSKWDHAVIATRWADNPNIGRVLMVVEARPGGAVEVPWPYETRPHLWSGAAYASPGAARHALGYAGYDLTGTEWVKVRDGVGYNYPDYAAIGVWHLVPFPQLIPGLRHEMAETETMICSQLVDQSEADDGTHLFSDGRPPGDTMPTDLGALLGQP
jgi:hypothetical protein